MANCIVHLSHWCNPRAYFADLDVNLLPSQLNIIWAWKKSWKHIPLNLWWCYLSISPSLSYIFLALNTTDLHFCDTIITEDKKKFLNFICYFLHVLCFMKRILHRWLVKYSILHSLICWQKEKYNIYLQITNLYIIF